MQGTDVKFRATPEVRRDHGWGHGNFFACRWQYIQHEVHLVEQNARLVLQFVQRGYFIEAGRLVMAGASRELLKNPDVKKAYLEG